VTSIHASTDIVDKILTSDSLISLNIDVSYPNNEMGDTAREVMVSVPDMLRYVVNQQVIWNRANIKNGESEFGSIGHGWVQTLNYTFPKIRMCNFTPQLF
jgi:hypothetical protein